MKYLLLLLLPGCFDISQTSNFQPLKLKTAQTVTVNIPDIKPVQLRVTCSLDESPTINLKQGESCMLATTGGSGNYSYSIIPKKGMEAGSISQDPQGDYVYAAPLLLSGTTADTIKVTDTMQNVLPITGNTIVNLLPATFAINKHEYIGIPPNKYTSQAASFASQIPINGSTPFDLQAMSAWNLTLAGCSGAVFMILASGIDGNHPALNVTEAYDFTTPASSSSPLNQSVDDYWMGTSIAGIIGGKKPLQGICQNAPLISMKVATWVGSAELVSTTAVISALANAPSILKNHPGFPIFINAFSSDLMAPTDQYAPLQTAISNAPGIFITPAGTGGADISGTITSYPAAFTLPNMLTIGALDTSAPTPTLLADANFDSTGSIIQLIGPGNQYLTTTPMQKTAATFVPAYDSQAGNYIAVAAAAGIIGMVLTYAPISHLNLTPTQMISHIKHNSLLLGGFSTPARYLNAILPVINPYSPNETPGNNAK